MLQQLQKLKTVCPNKQQSVTVKKNAAYYQTPLPLVCVKNVPQKQPTSPTSNRETLTIRNSLAKISRNFNSSLNWAWSPFRGSVAPEEVAKVRPLTFTWQSDTHTVSASDCRSTGWVWAFALLLKSQLKPSIFILSLKSQADVKIIIAVSFLI